VVKPKIDLTGQVFGKWKVLSQTDDYIDNCGKHYARWLCECQCDKHTIRKVVGSDLKSGKSSSCGCKQIESLQSAWKANKKYNTYDLTGEYGIGYTSKGEEFYFDLEDYDKIKDYCWHIKNDGYVASNAKTSDSKKRKTILFHNLIKKTTLFVDHMNHKKHDNRKSNLRIVTNSQNCMNHKLKSNNTSGVTGVSWDKKSNKWLSRIGINNREISLGFYDDFDTAVKVRKQAENMYHKEFSYDNSIKVGITNE
jgi:hypothetical protein